MVDMDGNVLEPETSSKEDGTEANSPDLKHAQITGSGFHTDLGLSGDRP